MSAREFSGLGIENLRLVTDSRKVGPGDVFVAYPGESRDGRAFIADAIHRGAGMVLWEEEGFRWQEAWAVANHPVRGLRNQLPALAAEAFGHPSRDLWLVGITGTNGKTTVSQWLSQGFNGVGRSCGVIGTLGHGLGTDLLPALNTTPDVAETNELLAAMRRQGAAAVAMEVSSIGLVQGRVSGLAFDVAVFTNLSRDHLDYHGSMEAYAEAKANLFFQAGLKWAVVNLDDPMGRDLAGRLGCRGVKTVGYSLGDTDAGVDFLVRGKLQRADAAGLTLEVATPWGRAHLETRLLGRFNAANLLAVLATWLVSGMTLEQVHAAAAALTPPPGRLQTLGGGTQPLVVVDYAHTPDALAKVLETLREITRGRLNCVFGCGGDRDAGKRPMMGEVAARLADLPIVTSDNPRGESPEDIIDAICDGMSASSFVRVADRRLAIGQAVCTARSGDVVLIAGKGHEDYQEEAGRRLPFSDLAVASRYLEAFHVQA